MAELKIELARTVFLPEGAPPLAEISQVRLDLPRLEYGTDSGFIWCRGVADVLIEYQTAAGESLFGSRANAGQPWQALLTLPLELVQAGTLPSAVGAPRLANLTWQAASPRAVELEAALVWKLPDEALPSQKQAPAPQEEALPIQEEAQPAQKMTPPSSDAEQTSPEEKQPSPQETSPLPDEMPPPQEEAPAPAQPQYGYVLRPPRKSTKEKTSNRGWIMTSIQDEQQPAAALRQHMDDALRRLSDEAAQTAAAAQALWQRFDATHEDEKRAATQAASARDWEAAAELWLTPLSDLSPIEAVPNESVEAEPAPAVAQVAVPQGAPPPSTAMFGAEEEQPLADSAAQETPAAISGQADPSATPSGLSPAETQSAPPPEPAEPAPTGPVLRLHFGDAPTSSTPSQEPLPVSTQLEPSLTTEPLDMEASSPISAEPEPSLPTEPLGMEASSPIPTEPEPSLSTESLGMEASSPVSTQPEPSLPIEPPGMEASSPISAGPEPSLTTESPINEAPSLAITEPVSLSTPSLHSESVAPVVTVAQVRLDAPITEPPNAEQPPILPSVPVQPVYRQSLSHQPAAGQQVLSASAPDASSEALPAPLPEAEIAVVAAPAPLAEAESAVVAVAAQAVTESVTENRSPSVPETSVEVLPEEAPTETSVEVLPEEAPMETSVEVLPEDAPAETPVEVLPKEEPAETPEERRQRKARRRRAAGLPRLIVDAKDNNVEISAFNLQIKL